MLIAASTAEVGDVHGYGLFRPGMKHLAMAAIISMGIGAGAIGPMSSSAHAAPTAQPALTGDMGGTGMGGTGMGGTGMSGARTGRAGTGRGGRGMGGAGRGRGGTGTGMGGTGMGTNLMGGANVDTVPNRGTNTGVTGPTTATPSGGGTIVIDVGGSGVTVRGSDGYLN